MLKNTDARGPFYDGRCTPGLIRRPRHRLVGAPPVAAVSVDALTRHQHATRMKTRSILLICLLCASIGCEPTRVTPVASCSSSAHCPADGQYFCDLVSKTCKTCVGSDCGTVLTDGGSGVADGAGEDATSADVATMDAGTGADVTTADVATATDTASADATTADVAIAADTASADATTADVATADAAGSDAVTAGDVATADGNAGCKHPAQCVGAAMPTWKLTDVQPKSTKYKQVYGLSGFVGKVTVLALLSGW